MNEHMINNLYSVPSLSHSSVPSDSSGRSIVFYPSSSPVMCVNISVTQDATVVTLDRGSDEGVELIDPNATVSIVENDCKSTFYAKVTYCIRQIIHRNKYEYGPVAVWKRSDDSSA